MGIWDILRGKRKEKRKHSVLGTRIKSKNDSLEARKNDDFSASFNDW